MARGISREGAWQRAMTLRWLARLAPIVGDGKRVLFEGQMRIAFILEGLAAEGISGARVVLVDCDDATRAARLRGERGQPELADENMMGWAEYLRGEAREGGFEILDTGRRTLEESVAAVRDYLLS